MTCLGLHFPDIRIYEEFYAPMTGKDSHCERITFSRASITGSLAASSWTGSSNPIIQNDFRAVSCAARCCAMRRALLDVTDATAIRNVRCYTFAGVPRASIWKKVVAFVKLASMIRLTTR